ncbi:diguanylate cyclase [Phreatobacter sp.]|uniref:GGDEF domain-containing protein n=1 Tax=Phreatobacter sp. TaxID=1966341 RepID=UPI0025DD75CC|nr:diguanylate cyclase [Phreatobacter sp.]
MPNAALPIVLNILVAGMFTASFLMIAQLNPDFRRVRWLALSYAVGMFTPLAELVLPLAADPTAFMILSYGSFLLALVLVGPALSIFYKKEPWWRAAGLVVVVGFVARLAIWGGRRDDLIYEFIYQTPFAIAAAVCAATVIHHGRRTALDVTLAIIFSVIAGHFLLKPFAASYLGSGLTAGDYLSSRYAMLSQSATGALLIAVGLTLLINVLQTVVSQNRDAAFRDSLTGLPNRRSLHQEFEAKKKRWRDEHPLALAIVDIDHFKTVNDQWGHDAGDRTIQAVSRALEGARPRNGFVSRVGGEEFVVLLPACHPTVAAVCCESLRLAIEAADCGLGRPVTGSIGWTMVTEAEDLNDALRRADRGLYRAKLAGRNRVEAEPISLVRDTRPGLRVVPLQTLHMNEADRGRDL